MPKVFTIPAEAPFLDTLVAGLFQRYGQDPASLARITIYLPSRRAARSLTAAFLRASGGQPILLPRLAALGDIDADEIGFATEPGLDGGLDRGLDGVPDGDLDLPPAIAPARRLLLLTRLVLSWSGAHAGPALLPGQAAALARDLAALLDRAQAERVDLDRLEAIVPDGLALHWQSTVDFLDILRRAWPAILAAEGALDPAGRLNRLLDAATRAWIAAPPQAPAIAAGFAAAAPATARFLGTLARLPQGALVLPGLDTEADPALWSAIREAPSHPQHGMAALLAEIGLPHEAVAAWHAARPPRAADPARVRLGHALMQPASRGEFWFALGRAGSTALRAGIAGLSRINCPDVGSEATTIALLLRQRLEIPGATAILITPDRALARRVAAELGRWGIEIDDSAGVPLNRTPPGAFLRLLVDAAAEALAPVPLLALLKHPLAAGGLAPQRFRALTRSLECAALRGPRPAPGCEGLRRVLGEEKHESLAGFVTRLETCLAPFLALIDSEEAPLGELLRRHLEAAEALAATDTAPGAQHLWAAEAGEALALRMAELLEAADDFGNVAGALYPALFEALLAGAVVRPRFGKHPRLQILGALEARLQQADLVILGGLNEGVWPNGSGHDPWMSRPMRRDFGVKPLEAEIGLAAHDFHLAFAAPEVVMTRAEKAAGASTQPSRWLLRLETVLTAIGAELPAPLPSRDWARVLDEPAAWAPIEPPAPRPPVALRPRTLSVTEIETWRRDPYAIYARHILKLRPLDPIDADPGAAERGQFIHRALDRYVRARGAEDDLDLLFECGREAFGEALRRPGIAAFWWPRFEAIARWFVEAETPRRAGILGSWTEIEGQIVLDGLASPFVLKGRADRIEQSAAGALRIVDYKTGSLPKPEELRLGYAPQLALLGAIAEAGGFPEVPAAAVMELAHWKLTGRDPAGEIKPVQGELRPLIDAAREGLATLIRHFDDEATPYRARPRPERAPRYSDYEHLARVREWGAGPDPVRF